MKLPANQTERYGLYRNCIRECEISRADRQSLDRRLRTWYLCGSEFGEEARYNKLQEHVAYSSSYLYAPSNVRFGVSLPPHYGEEWMEEEEAAREEWTRVWHESGAWLTFGLGVEWAHVYPTNVFKIIMNQNQPELTLVSDPGDLGVWRESLNTWDHQEAICHWYMLDVAQFRRIVEVRYPGDTHKRKREELINAAGTYAGQGYDTSGSDTLPNAVQQTLLLAQSSPRMIGVAQAPPIDARAMPRERVDVVPMAELWIWDDEIRDYRVVTNFLPTEDILWEPKNSLIAGDHPFYPLCLQPVPGYLWGKAPIAKLIGLQAAREQEWLQLDERHGRQLDPPIFAKGISRITDEEMKAFRRRGGSIATAVPHASVEAFPPSPMADEFGMLHEIDQMFARAGGLPMGMQGQTEQGVRSGEQATAQAQLGAGPTLEHAMRVEKCLEAVATAMMKLHRRTEDRTIKKADGAEMLLSQMTGDLVVRVWGHSASPIYADKVLQKAVLAMQHGAIGKEDFLEMIQLPLTDLRLKAKVRRMDQAQAEKSDRVIQMKEAEAQAKIIKAKAAAAKL